MNSPHSDTNVRTPVGIVSGSGLDLLPLLDDVDRVVSFSEIDGLPTSNLEGHPRTFAFGRCGATAVILQSGRLHFYEGFDYAAITRPVEIMYGWGVRTFVFTNVGGGLLPSLEVGDIIAVDRLLTWPFQGWRERVDSIVPDVVLSGSDAVGTYVWMHGPSYETPAEIRLLQRWGASVVGMSTAPEVQRCRRLGVRSAVLSCITNNCCHERTLTHADVIAAAGRASERIVALIRASLEDGALG